VTDPHPLSLQGDLPAAADRKPFPATRATSAKMVTAHDSSVLPYREKPARVDRAGDEGEGHPEQGVGRARPLGRRDASDRPDGAGGEATVQSEGRLRIHRP
jgi:hypothetical protein